MHGYLASVSFVEFAYSFLSRDFIWEIRLVPLLFMYMSRDIVSFLAG